MKTNSINDEIDLDKSPQVRENIKELIDKVKIIEVQISLVKIYKTLLVLQHSVEGMQLSKSNSKEFFLLTDVSNEV